MRVCSGTRADVCKVRSCPLLQDTVRTEATDIGMRCHGPKITPSAIWKTKMHGRIQLTSFQLSQQLACSLCYTDPLLAARGCRWFILLKIRCHPPKALSPGYLFLLSLSISPMSQHHCCMQCKLHLWEQVQNVILLLPLIPLAFIKVIFLNSNFWHLCVISLGRRGWTAHRKAPAFPI